MRTQSCARSRQPGASHSTATNRCRCRCCRHEGVRRVRSSMTDNGNKGTDNGNKGTDNGNKGTDNGNKGTDNGNKGTDNGNKGTDNGNKGRVCDGYAAAWLVTPTAVASEPQVLTDGCTHCSTRSAASACK
jgi:hypothetical protein